jgi:hypothetical protein
MIRSNLGFCSFLKELYFKLCLKYNFKNGIEFFTQLFCANKNKKSNSELL